MSLEKVEAFYYNNSLVLFWCHLLVTVGQFFCNVINSAFPLRVNLLLINKGSLKHWTLICFCKPRTSWNNILSCCHFTFYLCSVFNCILGRRCADALVRFRDKNYLVRVRKTCFGFAISRLPIKTDEWWQANVKTQSWTLVTSMTTFSYVTQPPSTLPPDMKVR